MKISYPKYANLNDLGADDFTLLAEVNRSPITAALHGMGYEAPWLAREDAVAASILEMVEHCLQSLRDDPAARDADCTGGRIRVVLNVWDVDWDGRDEIVPSIFLVMWDT